MAKTKTIDQAIDELLKDYENIIVDAAKYATGVVCEEAWKYSVDTILSEYYENYEPTSYDRTDYLWHAILPYAEHPRTVGGNIVSTVGVEYDSSVLDNIYTSGSTKYGAVYDDDGHISQYGHPDGEWVLNNYLMGIHPRTNGARNPAQVEYLPVMDDVSPWKKMEDYLVHMVPERFQSNLYLYFLKNLK